MPNRIIKDTINESRGLSGCTFFAQDLFKRLITYADDYGRFNADIEIMIARLYPRDLDIIQNEYIMSALVELVGAKKIMFYTSNGRDEVYGCFPNWSEHQRVRDSKRKCPDPSDATINDSYLRTFIPMNLKIQVAERDNCCCRECGIDLNPFKLNIKELIKSRTGTFHFDHEVPKNQRGRATLENIRLLCPKCNLSRKKYYTYEEILNFAKTCGNSPQSEETFLTFPPNPIQSNPIESSCCSSKKNETPENFYNNNIAPITQYVADDILNFINDGYEEEFILRMMQEAVKNEKRNWKYISTSLFNNGNKGIKTLAEYEANEAKRTREKQNESNSIQSTARYKDMSDYDPEE